MQSRNIWIITVLVGAPLLVHAQWVNHRDPKTPRTRDGKANLSAPAPRVSGKPDLSGVWEVEGSSAKELEPYLLPGGVNGLGEDAPTKYFLNFFSDFKFGQEPFQPAAAAVFQRLMQSGQKPPTLCPPPSVPIGDLYPAPLKVVQTPGVIILLSEADTTFRQIFTDGRKLPDDPQPSWQGYSVGKWEGDTLVVDTVGFNDMSVLDAIGHFHSEAMHVTERFHRRDFGHTEVQITVDDPKTYTKPVTISVNLALFPDTDVIESFCAVGEQDLAHMPGK